MNNKFKNSLNNETQTESQWRARLAYKCGICDTEFESIKDRAECEIKCIKMKEEREKFEAAKKKAEEQKARKAEVDKAVDRANELIDKYVEDYGTYRYNGILEMIDDDNDDYITLRDFLRMLP